MTVPYGLSWSYGSISLSTSGRLMQWCLRLRPSSAPSGKQVTWSAVLWCLAAQYVSSELRGDATIDILAFVRYPRMDSACFKVAASSKRVWFFSSCTETFLGTVSPSLNTDKCTVLKCWKRKNFFVIKADSKVQFNQFLYTRHFWRLEAGSYTHHFSPSLRNPLTFALFWKCIKTSLSLTLFTEFSPFYFQKCIKKGRNKHKPKSVQEWRLCNQLKQRKGCQREKQQSFCNPVKPRKGPHLKVP